MCLLNEGEPRMIIFAVLGPLLAWLIAIAFLVAVSDPKPVFENGWYWPASLMVSYAFSILPMMFAGWIDSRLSGQWWRSIACFAVGFGLAFALYYGLTHEGGQEESAQIFQKFWFQVGLVWGLPAAVCSWVLGKTDRPEKSGI